MFGRKKDMIDEMDNKVVNEMDIDSEDHTSEMKNSDYFDSSRYYDTSRYESKYANEHNSHLCEDGHDHDEIDKKRNNSANYKAKHPDSGRSSAGHLCEEGESHDRRQAARDEEFTSFTDFTPGHDSTPQPGIRDSKPAYIPDTARSGRDRNQRDTLDSTKNVFIDPQTYTRPETSESGAAKNTAGIAVLIILAVVFLCAGAFPITIVLGIAAANMIKNNKKNND
ncbi:MAG: hypothetical protein IJ874_08495 [Ruminococcus sp.]|nr:hypothetical protein [Ruminococcus sp.]